MHYGWIIFATGALVLFACLGLTRFAYTMLLPGMQAGLGLAYDRMGSIATANFIGYLLAVRLTPALLSRLGPRPTITGAPRFGCRALLFRSYLSSAFSFPSTVGSPILVTAFYPAPYP
ncbi:MAG: YbfB/YjiJ family MFS transporter [Desulfobacterales bacterium]|nr:YbfB/YjiJ family MFS transporter [Desulfobacterales bacterium]